MATILGLGSAVGFFLPTLTKGLPIGNQWVGFYKAVRLLLCNLTCCEITIVFILQYINTTKKRSLDSAIKVAKLHNRLNIFVFWVVSLYKEKSKQVIYLVKKSGILKVIWNIYTQMHLYRGI